MHANQETIHYIIDFAKKLLAIPSPSGYTAQAIDFVDREVQGLGYPTERTKKGNLVITVAGRSSEILALSGHVDTLGAMVRSINGDGTLRFT
ncbi:MAG: aminopeptidase, partial [bacterium]